ncbi:hypothetical protein [Paenibacillus shenyangensis]|uniref:hypothetical protein n=1 Tax=Paenibacillus sp. A9 TaxID=1284352 RepID=UPI000362D7AE|nr:hypothetical protein [Paenibacillus sp. A9]
MNFNHPDIDSFYNSFLRELMNIEQFTIRTANDVKIRSVLNTDVYTKATRFLEGSVKHIIYTSAMIRGDNSTELLELVARLKSLNNPKFDKIKTIIMNELNFNIEDGFRCGAFIGNDKTLLDEIVNNRHRNVHASEDVSQWYNSNAKDIENFKIEFESMIKIISYIDGISFDSASNNFVREFP